MRIALALALLAAGACAPRVVMPPATTPAPARTMFVESRDVRLFVRVIGPNPAAPVVVLVHGGPGLSCDYMVGLEALAGPDLTVVSYDQRGVGLSTRPTRAAYERADYVADLEAVRAAMRVQRIHVIGHSWGGHVAQAYLVAHTNNVSTLTLIGSIPPRHDDFEPGLGRFDARRKELVEDGIVVAASPAPAGDDCSGRVRANLPVYFADPRDVRIERLRPSCSVEVSEATWQQALGDFDLGGALAKTDVPTLVLTGEKDPFGVEWATATAAAFPAARRKLVIVPDVGHFPWIEAPDAVFPMLRALVLAPR